jgi:hypothetical protein
LTHSSFIKGKTIGQLFHSHVHGGIVNGWGKDENTKKTPEAFEEKEKPLYNAFGAVTICPSQEHAYLLVNCLQA